MGKFSEIKFLVNYKIIPILEKYKILKNVNIKQAKLNLIYRLNFHKVSIQRQRQKSNTITTHPNQFPSKPQQSKFQVRGNTFYIKHFFEYLFTANTSKS